MTEEEKGDGKIKFKKLHIAKVNVSKMKGAGDEAIITNVY